MSPESRSTFVSTLVDHSPRMDGEKNHTILQDDRLNQIDHDPVHASWQAWVVQAAVMILNAAVNLTWLTASSAPEATSIWLHVSLPILNWLANASAIINTIVSIPTAWAYERFGIKTTLLIAALINMTGCWIRFMAVFVAPDYRYTLVMLGHAFAGIAGPMTTNLLLSDVKLLVIAIVGTVAAAVIPFIPSKPKFSPSVSATQERLNVWAGIKNLFQNKEFIWLLILSSTAIGMALCYSAIIMEAIIPFGYTEAQAGLCVAILFISGFVGAVLPNAFSVVILACIANGFFSYGLISVYLELASEVTYPVPESVSNCVISATCTITAFLFTVMLDALRAGPESTPPLHMQNSCIAAALIVAIGSLPCLFLKGEMKRLAVDMSVT
ncbi:MFS general substrate transporter [Hesseltinella vesiculosa]|uniref:MFS general substrate transporter n=1 Tax=Hesseltinella vesiculosa TaxID=101127 RepID=A0A1X2GBV2_9FUNG|nr:MFS general substrate transporter [Hesseltinella vesiculosa]